MSPGQVPETSRMLATRTHHVYADAWPTEGLPAPPWSLGLRGTIPKFFGCLGKDPKLAASMGMVLSWPRTSLAVAGVQ